MSAIYSSVAFMGIRYQMRMRLLCGGEVVKCCDQDGYIQSLRFAARAMKFFRLYSLSDRIQRVKIEAVLLRHPWLDRGMF